MPATEFEREMLSGHFVRMYGFRIILTNACEWSHHHEKSLDKASCSPLTASSARHVKKYLDFSLFRSSSFTCKMFLLYASRVSARLPFVWVCCNRFHHAWNVCWAWHRRFSCGVGNSRRDWTCFSLLHEQRWAPAFRCLVSHPLPKTRAQMWHPQQNCISSKNLFSLMVGE